MATTPPEVGAVLDSSGPWGLRALRLLEERRTSFEDHHLICAEAVAVFKVAHGEVITPQIFSGPERIGGDSALAAWLGVKPDVADISCGAVMAVSLTAGVLVPVLAAGISGFMGNAICLQAMVTALSRHPTAGGIGSVAPTPANRRRPVCGGRGRMARRNFRTPLGVVSFAENLFIAAMGAVMPAGG